MDLNFNSFNKYITKSYGHYCFDAMKKVFSVMCDNASSKSISSHFVLDYQKLGLSPIRILLGPYFDGITLGDDFFYISKSC